MLKSCHVNKFVNKLLVGFPPPSFPWIRGIGKLGSTPSLWEPHWPKTGWGDDKFKLCLLLFLHCWGSGSSVMSAEFKEWSETPFCHWKNRPGSQKPHDFQFLLLSFKFRSSSHLSNWSWGFLNTWSQEPDIPFAPGHCWGCCYLWVLLVTSTFSHHLLLSAFTSSFSLISQFPSTR